MTEWSPIRSVIVQKRESDLLVTGMDNTMSCYQLIKTMTKFEKRTNHRLSAERFKTNAKMNAENPAVYSTKCTATARAK